jgi:hypothetical protein
MDLTAKIDEVIKALDVPAESDIDCDTLIATLKEVKQALETKKGPRLYTDTVTADELYDLLMGSDDKQRVFVSVQMNDEIAYFPIVDYNDQEGIIICGDEIHEEDKIG